MTELTDVERARLRALAEAATPGPWSVENVGNHGDKSASIECARWRGYVNTIGLGDDFATAEFIAAARTAVPALLAENAELRAALEAETARADRLVSWKDQGFADRDQWREREQRLRDGITALAGAADAEHEKHLHTTRRSAPDHRPCETGARAKFGQKFLALVNSVEECEDSYDVPPSGSIRNVLNPTERTEADRG